MAFTHALIAFFGLSIIQFSVALVYKLAQSGGKYGFSPASALAMAEFFKLLLALGMHFVSTWQQAAADGASASIKEIIVKAYSDMKSEMTKKRVAQFASLAFLYAINNHFAFVLFLLADASSVTLLKSGSSFISAIMAYLLVQKLITSGQWLAIFLQVCGLIVVQYDSCKQTTLLSPFIYGLLLIHVIISCFNSIWNENLVKSGNKNASLNVQNCLLYVFGTVFNFIAFWILPNSLYGASEGIGFFTGYNWSAILVVFLNSIIGIAITAVYKYADVIIKTFATACATGSLYLVEWMLFGKDITIDVLVGVIIVYVASYSYFTNSAPPTTPVPVEESLDTVEDDSVLGFFICLPEFVVKRFCYPQQSLRII